MRTLVLCLLTLALLFPAVPPAASGDGGMFWDVNDFDVTEPGQNAIIAWNGTHETLILSVDVQTSGGDTKAVHVVPFPSLPSYSLASAAEFSAIDDHFRSHRWYRHDIPSFWQLIEHDILAGEGGNYTDGADGDN
ncbi:MAG: hypothetical protein KAJ19_09270, partial [Gammaproteobacteria bacterium]|nr:hypothetical protein [Gammaproteobacteria bacterium]